MKNFEHAAEVLTVLMEERDLTAAELSRQTEVNAGTIRNLMTGRQTNISTRNLMTLARAAERAVQIHAVRPNVQRLDTFPEQDGAM